MSRYRNSDKTYQRVNNNDIDNSESNSHGNDNEYEIITSLEQKKRILESNRLVNRNKRYQIIKKIVHFFKS